MKKFLLYSFITFSLFNYSQSQLTMQNGNFEMCDATFRDSGGSSPYSNNENFTMTICPETEGDYIRLTFSIATGFITDSTSDILTIYNGDSIDAPLVGVYSSGNGPGIINAYNPSGCLTFNFVSDASGTSFGWSGDITCISNFIIIQPTDYELCAENNSTAAEYDLESRTSDILGDLDPNDYVVTYHESYDSAVENVNPFISPYTNYLNPQRVYTRVTELSSGDYNIALFWLILNGVDIEPTVYEVLACDEGESDGITTFDLTFYEDIFTYGDTNISLSYFETYDDAIDNTNVISNPSAYINSDPYDQVVIIRYEDLTTGCTFVSGNSGFFYLIINDNISINEPTTYLVCDEDNDGIATFDLTLKDEEISGGQPDLVISYYETQSDADNGINAITTPYTNISQFTQEIYARIVSTDGECWITTSFNIETSITACEDFAVYLINPSESPRPGFDYENYIIIENLSATDMVSGSIEFTRDDLLVINAVNNLNPNYTLTNTANGFTINFVNLAAGTSEVIEISLNCPSTVALGDIVTNTVIYDTAYSENNLSELSEIVIGAYDPNDKMEVHGPDIVFEDFITSDEYLYYTIRFQNVGTADAINVRIEDVLDDQLDESTFQMIRSSHNNEVTRTNNNLEWNFENINLPAEQDDAEGSNGYVYFKIKPNAGYAVGDIIENSAAIYFDFNEPIITNTFQTEFIETLSVSNHETVSFTMFPNPTKDEVTIQLPNSSFESGKVTVFDIQGKIILKEIKLQDQSSILDISILESGLYFVELNLENSTTIKKLIVN